MLYGVICCIFNAVCILFCIIAVYREKELLMTALSFLDAHEREAQTSDFPYQLETKVSTLLIVFGYG